MTIAPRWPYLIYNSIGKKNNLASYGAPPLTDHNLPCADEIPYFTFMVENRIYPPTMSFLYIDQFLQVVTQMIRDKKNTNFSEYWMCISLSKWTRSGPSPSPWVNDGAHWAHDGAPTSTGACWRPTSGSYNSRPPSTAGCRQVWVLMTPLHIF